jgi:replication factor A1
MAPLDDVLSRIESHTRLKREEIKKRIEAKQKELMNLVSEEGAAHIVAKELGVNMSNAEKRKLELRNILPGMRNVTAAGRVFRTSNIVDFKKSDGSAGRVVNLFVGDKSGSVRVTLWDDQVNIVEDELVKLGDIVQISGALSRENIYGDVELTIGKYGRIFQINEEAEAEDIDFPTVNELNKVFLSPQKNRVPIKNISPGNFEVCGIIVDVTRGNFIFNTCPQCGGKLSYSNGAYTCEQHGDVDPKPEMVVSFMADDGTAPLRVVAFRDLAERLATTTASELSKLTIDDRYKRVSGSLLGKEYIIQGNVKKNRRFDRLEMIANSVQNLNISEESERLAELLKMRLE